MFLSFYFTLFFNFHKVLKFTISIVEEYFMNFMTSKSRWRMSTFRKPQVSRIKWAAFHDEDEFHSENIPNISQIFRLASRSLRNLNRFFTKIFLTWFRFNLRDYFFVFLLPVKRYWGKLKMFVWSWKRFVEKWTENAEKKTFSTADDDFSDFFDVNFEFFSEILSRCVLSGHGRIYTYTSSVDRWKVYWKLRKKKKIFCWLDHSHLSCDVHMWDVKLSVFNPRNSPRDRRRCSADSQKNSSSSRWNFYFEKDYLTVQARGFAWTRRWVELKHSNCRVPAVRWESRE